MMVESGRSLTSGGVMAASGATAGCLPATGKTQRGRADVVIYDAPKRPGWNPHPPFNGQRSDSWIISSIITSSFLFGFHFRHSESHDAVTLPPVNH